MNSEAAAEAALRDVTTEAWHLIRESGRPVNEFIGTALYDMERDEQFVNMAAFSPAILALKELPEALRHYAAEDASRLVLQFVYTAVKHSLFMAQPEVAFRDTWVDFRSEAAISSWTFRGVANLEYFDVDTSEAGFPGVIGPQARVIRLDNGVIIAGRSTQTLEPLGFDERVIEKLREDWSGPGASSFVIVAESQQTKTPENLILSGDGQPEVLANLTVTAMRLVHSGHVGIGPMFVVRPALFNVGLSGLHQSGWPRGPVFGRRFLLTPALLMPINRTFEQLQMLERRQGVPVAGNLSLAIRYFSASFERRSVSDSVVDLVTSLEAVLGTDIEISFRLATRVAQLLGSNDEERVDLFRATKLWYDLRSTVVHGEEVKAKHQPLLADPEPLREIVRRLLRGFLQLTSIEQSPYSKRFFAQDLDACLLSVQNRGRLRSAMGLEGSPEPDAS